MNGESLWDLPASLVASACVAAAVFAVAWVFANAAAAPRDDVHLAMTERERVEALRMRSFVFRWFEPLVVEIGEGIARNAPPLVERLQKDLDLIEPEANWIAAEYYGIKRIESAMLFLPALALGTVASDLLSGLVFAAILAYLYPVLAVRSVRNKAKLYRLRIRNRLPLLTDLCALMMDAGEDLIRNCLRKVAEESDGHPIGLELNRLEARLKFNEPEAKALQDMAIRIEDADLSEFVFTVVTATQRGVPVAFVMSETASRLRNRRVQWLEQAAEEAKVKITGPALLVMIACLAIIVAPFLLAGLNPGP